MIPFSSYIIFILFKFNTQKQTNTNKRRTRITTRRAKRASAVSFDPDKIKKFNLFSWFGKWYNYVVIAIVIICVVVLCVILGNSAKCFIYFRQLNQRCRNSEQEDVEMGLMIDGDDGQYEREEEVGTS